MVEVEGKVDAISIKNKGIKVSGKWYNFEETLLDKVKNINKGDRVKVILDDFGNVTDILKLSSGSDISLRLESLKITVELLKIYYQVSIPSIEFEEAAKKRDTLEGFISRVLKTAEEIEKWIKG